MGVTSDKALQRPYGASTCLFEEAMKPTSRLSLPEPRRRVLFEDPDSRHLWPFPTALETAYLQAVDATCRQWDMLWVAFAYCMVLLSITVPRTYLMRGLQCFALLGVTLVLYMSANEDSHKKWRRRVLPLLRSPLLFCLIFAFSPPPQEITLDSTMSWPDFIFNVLIIRSRSIFTLIYAGAWPTGLLHHTGFTAFMLFFTGASFNQMECHALMNAPAVAEKMGAMYMAVTHFVPFLPYVPLQLLPTSRMHGFCVGYRTFFQALGMTVTTLSKYRLECRARKDYAQRHNIRVADRPYQHAALHAVTGTAMLVLAYTLQHVIHASLIALSTSSLVPKA